MCNFLLKYTPSFIAPNVLTFAGALCCLFAHMLVMSQTENLSVKENAASWPFFLAAVLIFLYQVLDNLDGK